jgi:hypothetical protein
MLDHVGPVTVFVRLHSDEQDADQVVGFVDLRFHLSDGSTGFRAPSVLARQ